MRSEEETLIAEIALGNPHSRYQVIGLCSLVSPRDGPSGFSDMGA